ncbi:MAG: bifunctional glutamate N-acetyltransferase/amino-acid acetyltransferase ArgJ [Candidatus Omnitrophica bacterium]|nr:bifunctional glutamate N-acetyltransferase/amino-acid acetyltransferase ArgJ [Candidatus Omnitrophota bacterium]
MKSVKGGVTAARGFLATGMHCGIKYKNKDLALIYSQNPCVACGVFTQNKVQAAPLKLTKKHLANHRAQAIVTNSGNANCCTGKIGLSDAQQMAKSIAKELGIAKENVLVASTGIIGKRLPIGKIVSKASFLVKKLNANGSSNAAKAILTTDTKLKQSAVKVKLGNKIVTIGGIAKGAGMIAPNMATMLAFLTTDAAIASKELRKTLKRAVDASFNSITVEGDTSTNDMVLILANGLAANAKLSRRNLGLFQEALEHVCLSLAKMIVKDAEGGTKFVAIEVKEANNALQAKKVALKVANSPLVKTAIYGENPNWGRIAACVGAADGAITQGNLSIFLGSEKVMHHGAAIATNSTKLGTIFKKSEIQIKICLGLGKAKATVYTSDLTHKYITINAEY